MANSARPAAPRNVVIILADDMGFADLGCYGSEVPTPNLDRLAARGVRFTNFHSTGKCFPSRSALLTGLYPQQTGTDRSARVPMQGGVTIAESLRGAGYRTLMVGKHHSTTHPMDRGFDRYRGLRDGAANYFNPGTQARAGEAEPARKEEDGRWWCVDRDCRRGLYGTDADFYATDAFTDWAIELLDEYRDEPKLLYLAYTSPHDPLHARPEDIARHQGRYDAGYAAIGNARYARQTAMGLIAAEAPRPHPAWDDWERLSEQERQDEARRMEVYAAMIDNLDRNIGRVLDWLEDQGELDDTLIIFSSDNGASAEEVLTQEGTDIGSANPIGTVGRWASLRRNWAEVANTPLRYYKNYSFNGGLLVPFIAHWPDRVGQAGAIVTEPAHLIDLHPTLLSLTGREYDPSAGPEPDSPALAGIDLSGLLIPSDETSPADRAIFNQWGGGRMVREGRWKLVSHAETGEADSVSWELYDLAADPLETRNVAGLYPERVELFAQAYENWMRSVAR
ncbi:arylsulfatase [Aurantiacibacter gangjinensis]|uniref:Sulfatase N-terminal domain-containing protein n=1 Tax=Aurantiacibacter gangjinensis TaxID=502682 RepID=A0A0G9MSN7_9SPHN|nr:arylsulfatase [Aurantiacibacter gangjinensis]KLE33705.1 hypothetical protein AAW01_05270 [Aurantiacibacter gangjinensis]